MKAESTFSSIIQKINNKYPPCILMGLMVSVFMVFGSCMVFAASNTVYSTNSVSSSSSIKITDMSGSLASGGAAITVFAWDVNGSQIPESVSAAALKLYNHGTTTITGTALAARFPTGTPVLYIFYIDSQKVVVNNVKSSTDGTINIPCVYTNGTTNFVTNSVGPRNTIKISDISGSLTKHGASITVTAWDANGNALPESASAAALKVYNYATTTITGPDLAARFSPGTPMTYEFTIGSSEVVVNNVKNSTDGTINIPCVYTSGTTNFVANSVGPLNTIKISDMSGSFSDAGSFINVRAWNAGGASLAELANAAPMKIYNYGTTSISGTELAARFDGTPMIYEFSLASSKYIVTNIKSSTDGTINIPCAYTSGTTKFVTNSVGTTDSIRISDVSGSLSASGVPITCTAWDVNGNAILESGTAVPLKLYSYGTTIITGSELMARFPSGAAVAYEFTVNSAKYLITNIKNTTNGALSIPTVYMGEGTPVPMYTLSISKSGSGSGTVTSSPSGVNCGSTCSASFTAGTAVTLTATAASGYAFLGWTGACYGTGTCVVTMNSAQTVTAAFSASSSSFAYLTVSKSGSGSGTVTSSPSGISCGSTCSAAYSPGTSVTLTATASSGSAFTGWSGGGCSGTGTCTIAMNSDQGVTATFTAGASSSHTLTVNISGAGRVTGTSSFLCATSTSTTCSQSYASGTSVTLTATPTTPYMFSGWSGACSGIGTCTVTMNSTKSVTAMFYYDPGGG